MMAMNIEILKELPLELRVNSLLGLIAKNEEVYGDFSLNLSNINDIVNSNIGEYNYNMIPEITSKEDLINLRDTIITATITDGPYRKCRCKQCKDTFYLSSGEVEFFRQKEFKMPKICKYCKKGIEKPKKDSICCQQPKEILLKISTIEIEGWC
jgi:hypothetical protein